MDAGEWVKVVTEDLRVGDRIWFGRRDGLIVAIEPGRMKSMKLTLDDGGRPIVALPRAEWKAQRDGGFASSYLSRSSQRHAERVGQIAESRRPCTARKHDPDYQAARAMRLLSLSLWLDMIPLMIGLVVVLLIIVLVVVLMLS